MQDLQRLQPEAFKTEKKNSLIILLDDVRSMHNVGSVFRTADAFAIEKIILCGITPCPPHRDIHKAALGATETVHWIYQASAIEAIDAYKKMQWKIVAVEQVYDSISLEKYEKKEDEKILLIFGSEVHGVNDAILQQCDASIEIPQFGTKHSLNISVSVGIVLWEILNSKNLYRK